MNFSVSSVQPVLGHLSQSAGNSQSAMGDSAIPPRKAVESDSFEKQSKPASGTVVPSVVTTAVLAPVLGVLAGEGTWQLGASDEKKSVSVPITAAELGTDGIPKPKVFDWANCEKDRPFYRTVKYIIETEQIPLINQSLGNDAEKATLEKHQFFSMVNSERKTVLYIL